MKIFSVFFFCAFMIFIVMNTSLGLPHASNYSSAVENATDEFIFSAVPFMIILEHQLRALKASKPINSLQNKSQVFDKNLKSIAKTSDNLVKNICSETELRKKVSPEEISKIFSGHINLEEDETRLQKIYDSVKDCHFVKIGSPKLWGPLWHCLNRLFLFFVFGFCLKWLRRCLLSSRLDNIQEAMVQRQTTRYKQIPRQNRNYGTTEDNFKKNGFCVFMVIVCATFSAMNERFHKAARDGVLEILKQTTKRDCNAKDEDGMTPTLWAAFEGNLEALRLLVARGGDPDKSDNFGNTALHHTADRGHVACVRFLTNFGANLWSLNCDMHTPKELAAIKNRGEILRFLDEAMAEQEASKRKEVKMKKEKAQKEAEKKLKEYEKEQKKIEKELKRQEKEREKMKEECFTNQKNSNRPTAVFQALKNKTGVSSLIVRGVTSSSPRFSEIVGTVTEANAKKFGIGAVHKKMVSKKFGSQRGDPPGDGDFKVVEIEAGKKSVKNLTGLQRDSEILYVGTYDKDKATGVRGKISDVFIKSEEIPDAETVKNKSFNGTILQEPASIFERPGFGNFAFRNFIPPINSLPVPAEEDETDEIKGEESSIGSAGSLVKRHIDANACRNSQWFMGEITERNCDIEHPDDIDSLEDDETSPLQLFLMSNGLGEYIGRFLAEKIDLQSLLMLTDEDLISLELPLGPRRKLMTAINNRKKALQEPGKVLDSQL